MERHKVENFLVKTIDDPILIDQLITDRNAKHLNRADDTPFTVELLLSLVEKDTLTTFSQELLDGTADLSQLQLPPTIHLYMKNLKQTKTIVNPPTDTTIPYNEHVEEFKKLEGKNNDLTFRKTLGTP